MARPTTSKTRKSPAAPKKVDTTARARKTNAKPRAAAVQDDSPAVESAAIDSAAAPAMVPAEMSETRMADKPDEDTNALSRRELVDRVVATTGAKKPVVKQVVEAVLRELGDALSGGAELNLQPFGKASVKRVREMPNAEVLMLKLRRNRDAQKLPDADPIAPAAE